MNFFQLNADDDRLLTPEQMAKADRLTIEKGDLSGYALMQRAAYGVADCVWKYYAGAKRIAVLCGGGNNGGDGYMAAEILLRSGMVVTCYQLKKPKKETDAAIAYQGWQGETRPFEQFKADGYDLVIDALFGAGLDRELDGRIVKKIDAVDRCKVHVIAVDLPSGISGATGAIQGRAFKADHTVTFFRLKPGHVLYPGRDYCGEIHLVDIGISSDVLYEIGSIARLNKQPKLHIPPYDTHKYQRGHVAVFSGPELMTGASRLSALAAMRAGCGAVTLLGDQQALRVHAAHVTSVMLHDYETTENALQFLRDRKVTVAVLGPGFGVVEQTRELVLALLEANSLHSLVLDADALSAFEGRTEHLFEAIRRSMVQVILTPHEGEFSRLFPDISKTTLTRIEKIEAAIKRCSGGATLVYKGADTIIACGPWVSVNTNGTPYLATAGSGDVLAGLIAGLSASGRLAFTTACEAVYIHAEAANYFGSGMVAEDLIATLPKVLCDCAS